eukprot:TRINITY_DN36102_c0_g1_i1.p1 TRINITY_DN36102_c0_g1~~TRINITY_DN36102_c0_g1_i1.p1  ORF type:complete len:177 (+),score=20.50 TRINITY_DN36102_c0_g1_i1:49-579(+)
MANSMKWSWPVALTYGYDLPQSLLNWGLCFAAIEAMRMASKACRDVSRAFAALLGLMVSIGVIQLLILAEMQERGVSLVWSCMGGSMSLLVLLLEGIPWKDPRRMTPAIYSAAVISTIIGYIVAMPNEFLTHLAHSLSFILGIICAALLSRSGMPLSLAPSQTQRGEDTVCSWAEL